MHACDRDDVDRVEVDEQTLYDDCDVDRASDRAIGRMNLRIDALERERAGLMEERDALRRRCDALERNISCLFNTARAEMARKDDEIARLRGGGT